MKEEELEQQEKELEKVQEAKGGLRQRSGRVEYKLQKPFTWADKTYEDLVFDFEGLTGADMEKFVRSRNAEESGSAIDADWTGTIATGSVVLTDVNEQAAAAGN